MAFRDNAFATVWEVKPTRGSSMNVRISTSYKSKQTGNYETDFSDFCFFSGEAAKKVANCKPRDRIQLLQTSVTSQYDKNTKQSRYTFTVWDIDPNPSRGAGSGSAPAQASVVPPKAPAKDSDDELPF